MTFFALAQNPMTNGIHNKTAKGLTLRWSQQYFSHILDLRQLSNTHIDVQHNFKVFILLFIKNTFEGNTFSLKVCRCD